MGLSSPQVVLYDGSGNIIVGQKASAASLPVVIASDQSAVAISIAANGYGGQVEGRAATGAVPVGNPVYIGGFDGTDIRALTTDTSGRLVVAPASASASTSGFSFGDVSLTLIGAAAIRRTTLTEQASNAQRSIVSASALDTNTAGTGARQVIITYYDSTGAGPFTETVSLNGITAVNTVSSTICYVEKMVVSSVGATGSNAGIISLHAATAGAGAAVMTIGATDKQTFLALHYVPTGKTCHITGISIGSTSTTGAQGGLFSLRAQTLGVATAVEQQISDFLYLYGQSSGTTRSYDTPILVTGPSRVQLYVNPFSASTITYGGGFDFYEA